MKFMARDATRICVEDGELSPWAKEPAVSFAGAGGGETIYTAFDSASMGPFYYPSDAWAVGLVAATPQTIDGTVTWASTLERAGYGPEKPYGFRAFRLKFGDPWKVEAWAHFGLDGHDGDPGQEGRLSLFGYNNLVSSGALPTTAGSYRLFKGGTSTAGSGTNAGGDWDDIQAANWLEIGTLDKRGLPALVLEDLTADDWIVLEPKSNQWVTFDVLATPKKITNGYRVSVSLASVRGEGNVASSTSVRFLFSEPRRPKPAHAKTYVYDYNVADDPSEFGIAGSYIFYQAGGYTVVRGGAGKFPDLVTKAGRLKVDDKDEHANDALAWDKMKPEDKPEIIYEVSRNQWVAWTVTGRQRAGSGWLFDLELLAYDARGGLDVSETSDTEVLFRLSEYAEDPQGFAQLAIADFTPPTEGAGGTATLPLTATLTGVTAPVQWRWTAHGGNSAVVTSIAYSQSNTGTTSTATVNLGAISANTDVGIAVIARVPTTGQYLTELETFTYTAAT